MTRAGWSLRGFIDFQHFSRPSQPINITNLNSLTKNYIILWCFFLKKLIDTVPLEKQSQIEDVMKLRIKNLDTIKHLNTNSGNISINSSANLNYSLNDLKITSQLNTQINGDTAQAKVVNYILFIPLFIMLESLSKNRALFQRRSNTILNMKDASNFHTFNKRNV